jgi:hypothetical protein
LSRLTLSPAHSVNLLNINNDCSSDFELSSNINEESSAYCLKKYSESFIFTPVISGSFLIAALLVEHLFPIRKTQKHAHC